MRPSLTASDITGPSDGAPRMPASPRARGGPGAGLRPPVAGGPCLSPGVHSADVLPTYGLTRGVRP